MTQDEVIEMARQTGMYGLVEGGIIDEFEAFAKLVEEKATEKANARANASWTLMCEKMVAIEREACAKVVGEFAQKWWSIHCGSNKHMETTRKAHDDFCALQIAIRARGEQA
jgi:hypothetical protein